MPIRAENRARYPADWGRISQAIRERAGWRCEECGVHNGELGGRGEDGRWHRAQSIDCSGRRPEPGEMGFCDGATGRLRILRIVLTVAHLDHQPENCAPENLRALCQRCHNRYDQRHRIEGRRSRQRASMAAADLFAEAA